MYISLNTVRTINYTYIYIILFISFFFFKYLYSFHLNYLKYFSRSVLLELLNVSWIICRLCNMCAQRENF